MDVQAAAVIQSPFSNGGSPVPEGLAEATDSRFTYVPSVSAGGDATQGAVDAVAGGATLGQVNTGGVFNECWEMSHLLLCAIYVHM